MHLPDKTFPHIVLVDTTLSFIFFANTHALARNATKSATECPTAAAILLSLSLTNPVARHTGKLWI